MTKQTLRIYNVAQSGIAFAVNEETGDEVFISRQICQGMDVREDDVGRFITAVVSQGEKGPQTLSFDWVDEIDEDVIEVLEDRLATLEKRITVLEGLSHE